MAGIYPLSPDRGVVAVGAKTRLTFRLGALDMLLNGPPDLNVRQVPLYRTRDAEGGSITLSKTGRTALVNVAEPGRLYLCKAEDLRLFLKGGLNAVNLLDVTETG